MSKYRIKKAEHVEEKWVEGKTLCDFCHQDTDKVDQGTHTEIEIEAKIGEHYGTDGDARDGYRIDTCEQCFLSKVKPAIEALGVKWHEYNPEDSYPGSYGQYYIDDYLRMDGKTVSEVEEITGSINPELGEDR